MRLIRWISIGLLCLVGARGQIQTINSTDLISSAPAKLNNNFTYLQTNKTAFFSGSGAPGSISTSTLGSLYLNTAANQTYQCFAVSGSCTAVGSGNWVLVTGTATVTSVGLSLPAIFAVTGSPVTSSGTLTGTLANQPANQVFAGPASGAAAAPTFRAAVKADQFSTTMYTDQDNTITAGKLTTLASGAGKAGFNLPSGAAPTTPASGDIWFTGTALLYRDNTTSQIVEIQSNKNAASGYAGLTASTKLNLAQVQQVISVTDLTTYTATSGTGTTALLATITTPSSGQIISWNGTNWVNANPTLSAAHNLLSVTHGDTLASSPVLGGLIYANSTPAWQQLSGNTTTAKQFLAQTGTGTVSAAPTWSAIASTDLPAVAVLTGQSNTFTAGTQSFAAVTALLVPASAGFSPTANGSIGYNTTTNAYQFGVNGATQTVALLGVAETFSQPITYDLGTTPSNAVLLNMAQPTAAGTRNSHWLLIRGSAFDTTGHNADWLLQVQPTSNAGASTLVVQQRIDSGAFTTRASITDAGTLSSNAVNSTVGFQVAGAATSGLYLRGNGTNIVLSSVAAAGSGGCTNQFPRTLNDNAVPTCSSVAGTDFANQSANVVLAGPSSGGAAAPSYRSLAAADLPAQVQTVAGNASAATVWAGPTSGASAPATFRALASTDLPAAHIFAVANAGVTGTTLNALAKLTGAPSTAVITATTDTGGAIGVVIGGAGMTGSAQITVAGQASCAFDAATTAGDYVQISSTVTGNCHDSGASYPSSGQVVGRVLSSNATAGTYAMTLFGPEIRSTAPGSGTVTTVGLSMPSIFTVSGSPITTSGTLTAALATQSANLIFAGPSSGGAVAPTFRALVKADQFSTTVYNDQANTFGAFQQTFGGNIDIQSSAYVIERPNDVGTGTVLNQVAKLTAGGNAVNATTSDTAGLIGVVVGGAGLSGNAQIAVQGQANCAFDGSVTAGNFVQLSTTTNGKCHDAGTTAPSTGSVAVGRSLVTGVGAGTYAILLAGGPDRGKPTTTNLVHVKDYGAVGDNSTDDTTAFQNAINAVQGTQKTLDCSGGTYKTTATLSVTVAPFSLDGRGSCIIAPVASSGTVYGLQLNFLAGTSPTVVTVGVNTTSRATQTINNITVSNVSGYSAGTYVLLTGSQNGNTFIQLNRVRSVSGNVLTMWEPVGIPIQTTDTNSVQVLAAGDGLYVSGVTFDGIGITGTTSTWGLLVYAARNSIFTNIKTRNFAGGTSPGGQNYTYCYHCAISNLESLNDGSGGNNAIYFAGATKTAVSNVTVSSPSGFACGITQGVFNSFSNILASGAASGRGIKTAGLGWSSLSNLAANNFSGATGLSITLGSYRLTISGVVANNNGSNEGVWFSSQDNIYNFLSGVNAIGNVSYDISINSTDNFNTVIGLSRQSVINDLGTNNIVKLEGQGMDVAQFGCSGVAPSSSATVYMPTIPPGICTINPPVFTMLAELLPQNGILRNLRVLTSAAGVNASSGVFTVFVGGVATALTCTVGTSTSCRDFTHTVNVAGGQYVDVRFSTQASETLANPIVSLEY